MPLNRGTAGLMLLAVLLAALAVHYSLPGGGPLMAIDGGLRTGDAAGERSPRGGSAETASTLRPVRVLLGKPDRQRATLRIDGPYRIVESGSWRVLGQGSALAPAELEADGEAIRLGGLQIKVPRLSIDVVDSGTLWLDGRRYRGSLAVVRTGRGRMSLANHVDVEDYVASVVNGEMPGEFPPAAREAQAIAARSYALFQMKTFGAANDFDLYDTARSQVYQGMEWTDAGGRRLAVETAESRALAERTRGVVLLYQGRLFCAYFGAVCGGHTARGSDQFRNAAPPLVGVACDTCGDAPRSTWRVDLARETVRTRLADYLAKTGQVVGRIERIACRDEADGRLPSVVVTGSDATARLSAALVRRDVLRDDAVHSPFYSIVEDGSRLVVHGRGWGHGAGMCQWGARGMARQGADAAAILAHYYPGSALAVVR